VILYRYARVPSLDQDLSLQEEGLRAVGCQVVRAEKRGGAGREGRAEPRLLLGFLRAGDTLVVTRVDRLARSLKDLQDTVHELKGRGVALRCAEQPVDTGTAAKAFLDVPGVFAESETALRRERQPEGIAAAEARECTRGASPRVSA
jgi:DNA invertase Pin-like site-specific DNA recombinase